MASVVQSFVSTLSERGVRVVETPAAELGAVLETEIETPAVATGLDFLPGSVEDVSAPVTVQPGRDDLDAARTGVTGAALGIAAYGSVLIQGGPEGAEPVSLYAERHLAVLRGSDVVADMETAMDEIQTSIQAGNRSHVIATGPSATADMGELVEGAHGPRAVTVVVVTDR